MGRKLYMVWGSPPVNAVLMTAKALDVELEIQELDFGKKEYLEDWFVEMNPSHTVPTLDDNGFVLWDSHAIMVYLVEAYGKNSSLFPKDLKEKCRVLQMLNFDCGTTFRRMSSLIRPIFYEGQKTPDPKELELLKDAYTTLNRILKASKFVAGEQITIADISVFSSVIITNILLPIDGGALPHLKKWFEEVRSQDFYQAAEKGVETLKTNLLRLLERAN